MQSSIKITIPQPCTESWDLMTPSQKGRHCMLCSKTVVDFTSFTDDELIAFFAQQNGNVCGRVKTTQQNRSISPIPISQSTKQRWLLNPLVWVVPMLLGVSNSLFSQTTTTKKVNFIELREELREYLPTDSTVIIKGVVLDSMTGAKVITATVSIEGTKKQTLTDSDGRFYFKLSKKWILKPLTLIISDMSYDSSKIIITKKDSGNDIRIYLKEREMVLNEVVFTAKMHRETYIVGALIYTQTTSQVSPIKLTLWQRIKRVFRRRNK